MKTAALLSCGFLALVAVGHVLRLAFGLPLIIGSVDVPMWPSAIAALATGGLAVWLWREERQPAP